VDNIIVKSNSDMQKIINWAESYLNDIKNGLIHFNSPFDAGIIVFEEEGLKVQFISEDYSIRMNVYVFNGKLNTYQEMGDFVWNVHTFSPENKSYRGRNDDATRMMRILEITDSTFNKIGIKFMSLMVFATYYRPEFKSNKKTVGEQKNKKSNKHKKSSKKHSRTLYKRQYIISENNVSLLPKPKRVVKKCDHEYSVRGHYRHYKSGKVGWVSAYRKNVGKKKEEDRNYIAKIREDKRYE
jgi:hypothetical protein